MTPVIILVTASSQDEARQIAHRVLENKLAACVNIIPRVESHYWWEGKLEHTEEWQLLIKSSKEQFGAVSTIVHQLHSYICPEVVSFSPDAVAPKYLQWWRDEVKE
jgi:periplasmic divalent cation tolerance protein